MRAGFTSVCFVGALGDQAQKAVMDSPRLLHQDSCVGGARVSLSSTQQLPLPKQSPLTTPQSTHMSPLFQLCPQLILCTATLGGF